MPQQVHAAERHDAVSVVRFDPDGGVAGGADADFVAVGISDGGGFGAAGAGVADVGVGAEASGNPGGTGGNLRDPENKFQSSVLANQSAKQRSPVRPTPLSWLSSRNGKHINNLSQY